jgi:hypothetical protein
MQRHQLEHRLRASAAITGADRFVVVGSQAILGQFPDAPGELLTSIKEDLFSLRGPADSDLIDGNIGELSPFHQTFGYFARGVGEGTAVLSAGWKDRLVPLRSVNTGGATGLCLEVHDLAASKRIAGRPKDADFVRELFKHRLAEIAIIRERLKQTTLDEARLSASLSLLDHVSA